MKTSCALFLAILMPCALHCLIRSASAQIVGCDSNNIDCMPPDSDGVGVCTYSPAGIGVVSFDSNITSDGPLTWTVTGGSRTGDNAASYQNFWLGSPPALNFSDVTDYAACAMLFLNVTSALQLPADADLDNFSCGTVMGDKCATDIMSHLRNEVSAIFEDFASDPASARRPCTELRERLDGTQLPNSCTTQMQRDIFSFHMSRELTNGSEGVPWFYQSQDTCSVTTGGPSYNMFDGGFNMIEGNPNSEQHILFQNGTTPVLTLFYNEPWDNSSTGPFPGLETPEVHLHCLRTVPTAEQQSGGLRPSMGNVALLALGGATLATMML